MKIPKGSLVNGLQAIRQTNAALLTSEEKALSEAARQLAEREILPLRNESWEKKRSPDSLIAILADQGYLGLGVDEEFGGTPMSTLAQCLIVQRIAEVDPSVALILCVHHSLCANTLNNLVDHKLSGPILEEMTSGKRFGSFQLSEGDSASNPAGLKCKAVRKGDSFIINGRKSWISCFGETYDNGEPFPASGVLIARTDPESNDHKGLSAFLVDRTMPGITVAAPEKKLGLSGSSTNEITYDNVEVSEKNLIGEEGDGWKVAMYTLNHGRSFVCHQAVGTAFGCIEMLYEQAINRQMRSGTKLGELGQFQAKFGQMITHYLSAHALGVVSCRMADTPGVDSSFSAAAAKNAAAEMAKFVSQEALQFHGAMGQMTELPLLQFMLSSLIYDVYEGAREVHYEAIVRRVLNL